MAGKTDVMMESGGLKRFCKVRIVSLIMKGASRYSEREKWALNRIQHSTKGAPCDSWEVVKRVLWMSANWEYRASGVCPLAFEPSSNRDIPHHELFEMAVRNMFRFILSKQRQKARKGTVEEFKSVIKAILSGQRSGISCLNSVFCTLCSSYLNSLSLISFESGSNLQRIEEFAFSYSELQTIIIPLSAAYLCKSRFPYCRSLSSISLKIGSTCNELKNLHFDFVQATESFYMHYHSSNCIECQKRTDDELLRISSTDWIILWNLKSVLTLNHSRLGCEVVGKAPVDIPNCGRSTLNVLSGNIGIPSIPKTHRFRSRDNGRFIENCTRSWRDSMRINSSVILFDRLPKVHPLEAKFGLRSPV
jgi:hypothetical protein